MAILKVGADGKAPKGAKVGDTIQTAGGNFTITGGSSGNWTSTRTSANANSQGNAPSGLSTGTIVNTAGGQYKIVPEGTYGAKRNPQSGYWSVEASQPDWLTPTGANRPSVPRKRLLHRLYGQDAIAYRRKRQGTTKRHSADRQNRQFLV